MYGSLALDFNDHRISINWSSHDFNSTQIKTLGRNNGRTNGGSHETRRENEKSVEQQGQGSREEGEAFHTETVS